MLKKRNLHNVISSLVFFLVILSFIDVVRCEENDLLKAKAVVSYEKARAFLQENNYNYDAALFNINECLKLFPAHVPCRTDLAFIFYSIIGDKDKAEKEPATAGPGGKVELVERKKAVFDINLIPKELAGQEQFELPKKLFLSGLVVFIAILIVGGAYLGFTWYQLKINREIGALKTEIKTIEDQIAEQEKSKLAAIDLQQRLNLIKDLLNKHVYWTKFFEQLEKYTIDEVYYANFSMAGTEKVTLAAVGKDYESVAKQLVAFQQAKDFITQVDINSASAEVNEEGGYNRVSFNIDLVFLPEVFYKPIK